MKTLIADSALPPDTAQHQPDLLRFITAGSVDDGKSTLIGRLLYDSGAISLDVLETLERQSRRGAAGQIDLSLLTDGLRAEREQGITIDVAYKYFSTPRRKFIIADAPGHLQYTRNMVTAASTASLALILVDARLGVVEQTRRHSLLAALLGIEHIAVCINKMDMADYAQARFREITEAYQHLAAGIGLRHVEYIPLSALNGDNVVQRSANMPWYGGPTLLEYLESAPAGAGQENLPARMQVQYVIRPGTDALHDYRGYAGQVMSGVLRVGERVTILPAGLTATLSAIEVNQQQVRQAFAPQAVVLHLSEDLDISRGDMIAAGEAPPNISTQIEADICWFDKQSLLPGARLLLQHYSARTRCMVNELRYKHDLENPGQPLPCDSASLNDICRVRIRTAQPLAADLYAENRGTGAFILLHEQSGQTLAAGMIRVLL